MKTIGEYLDLRGEVNFEWKIKEFLQLTDACYKSPEFSFCDITWIIWISPNGHIADGSSKYVSLHLAPISLTAPITVDFSLHLKTVDGKVDRNAKFTHTAVFKENFGWRNPKLISRSELIERESELLPSGVLTINCVLKKRGTNNEADVSTLQQHFKDILQNGNLSDVILKVGDVDFKSHRCVLAARSPVFLAMMTHDTKEKNSGVVNIQDIEPNKFSDFLRYLYTGNGEIITQDNVIQLYTTADKYKVDELKKTCRDYMLKRMSVDNFCDILSLSLVHFDKDLSDVCTQFYIDNTIAVISTPMWLKFLKENPEASNELQLKQLKSNVKIVYRVNQNNV